MRKFAYRAMALLTLTVFTGRVFGTPLAEADPLQNVKQISLYSTIESVWDTNKEYSIRVVLRAGVSVNTATGGVGRGSANIEVVLHDEGSRRSFVCPIRSKLREWVPNRFVVEPQFEKSAHGQWRLHFPFPKSAGSPVVLLSGKDMEKIRAACEKGLTQTKAIEKPWRRLADAWASSVLDSGAGQKKR